jgi:hypothetical protein
MIIGKCKESKHPLPLGGPTHYIAQTQTSMRRMGLVALAAAMALAAVLPAVHAGIGPGPNEWQVCLQGRDPLLLRLRRSLAPHSPQTVPAETFGISTQRLTAAASELADAALYRYCTIVVKDGYILHEQVRVRMRGE